MSRKVSESLRDMDELPVAVVELHRPERGNALTGPLLDQLAE